MSGKINYRRITKQRCTSSRRSNGIKRGCQRNRKKNRIERRIERRIKRRNTIIRRKNSTGKESSLDETDGLHTDVSSSRISKDAFDYLLGFLP